MGCKILKRMLCVLQLCDGTVCFLVWCSYSVRQGGVLSPVLFALYVNDLILALAATLIICLLDV